jgi:ABC-type lipoprotein export system ATPase subunit
MTTSLSDLLLERLQRESKPKDDWPPLVLAAIDGANAVDELLAARPRAAKAARPAVQAAGPAKPGAAATGAYLRSITVEGFRGVGRPAMLELVPGPGLTLVFGRNGSGKSSFAEALEQLLTGDTFRWANRTKEWRDGWRNLHHPHAALRAELALEGERAPCVVAGQWPDDGALEDGETWAQVQGKPRTALAALGWTSALETYRPFLSYNELGSMLDEGPSKLYDALSAILGLDALVEAQAVLQKARTSREKALKEAQALHKELLAGLPGIEDERAQAVAIALGAKDWGLDKVEQVLAGSAAAEGEEGALRLLRELAALPAASAEAVTQAAAALRAATAKVKGAAKTVAARSRDLAEVLDHALRFHERHGDGECPVCGRAGALTAKWRAEKAAQARDLRDAAREVDAAQRQAADARAQAQRLPAPRADAIERAPALGPEVARAAEALRAWTAGLSTEDGEALADHLEKAGPRLRGAVEALRRLATAELQKREDAWRPFARQIAAWVETAREARQGAAAVPALKKAEEWVKDAGEAIRNERFDPIAQRSIGIWNQLRLNSNVTLGSITLESAGKRRRVDLHVQVDGVEGAALGVMSQGELHCLALSLFIPRATVPESPFRFIVIDDPVQSMDPARVDGLARVLQAAAKDRQVIVFTHDDRLPEAVRRLGIDARAIEVTRREGSIVQTRAGRDPVSRNIEDAIAVAKTEGLPAAAARRVIPGLCRVAIEAACTEAVRKRRLARGERHRDVEELLAGCAGTRAFVSLALFDDPQKAGDVLPRLDKESRDYADVYRMCNEGAHGVEVGGRIDFVRTAEKLARWLQQRP